MNVDTRKTEEDESEPNEEKMNVKREGESSYKEERR